ncbi:tRNA dimethylallyltransferase, partial [Dissostichus eleginoides]
GSSLERWAGPLLSPANPARPHLLWVCEPPIAACQAQVELRSEVGRCVGEFPFWHEHLSTLLSGNCGVFTFSEPKSKPRKPKIKTAVVKIRAQHRAHRVLKLRPKRHFSAVGRALGYMGEEKLTSIMSEGEEGGWRGGKMEKETKEQ